MSGQISQHVGGSLADMAKRGNASLAETFIGCDAVVIVDTSASMDMADSRGGRKRYTVACEELAALQANMPGRIGVIAFSTSVVFVPGGQPPYLGGGTDLASALRFARIADVAGMRFIVISDGEPDNEAGALAEAAQYRGRIDTVYVGPEARPYGRDFLARLAAASGGMSVTADRAHELAASVERLLLGA